jgi:hypothetical protein
MLLYSGLEFCIERMQWYGGWIHWHCANTKVLQESVDFGLIHINLTLSYLEAVKDSQKEVFGNSQL